MREARKITQNKIYHVIIRGINKQDIFLDNQDKGKFKKELKKTKEKFGYLLYAYVIMPNHVHLIIYDKNNNLSKMMHSILISFSEYINKKYERVGHLFQNRFKSKPIEDEEYLKTAVMYIHYNPEKAGIARHNEYEWSSYREYINADNYNLVDTEYVIELMKNTGNTSAIAEFVNQHKEYKESRLLEIKNRIEYELENKIEDEEIISFIVSELKIKNIYELQHYNFEYLKQMLTPIFKELNVSAFQLARITGIQKNIIYKIKESAMAEKSKNDCDM